MIGSRSPLLAAALLCGALLAGCGSSNSSTGSSGSTASTAASTAATTTSATTTSAPSAQASTATTAPSPSSIISGAASATGVAEYAAICKEIIQRDPELPANVKSKVEGICAKAAAGNLAGARAAAKEVCVEVINASPITAAAKTKALAECKAT